MVTYDSKYNATDYSIMLGNYTEGSIGDTFSADKTGLVVNETTIGSASTTVMYYMYSRFNGGVENWSAAAARDQLADGVGNALPSFAYLSWDTNTADGTGGGNLTLGYDKNNDNVLLSTYSNWSVTLKGVTAANNSNISFAIRYNGVSGSGGTGDFDHLAACIELKGMFCGTEGRRLYLCQLQKGSLASLNNDATNYKFLEVQSNTGLSTTWDAEPSKSILDYVQNASAFGAGCTDYRIDEVRLVIRADTTTVGGAPRARYISSTFDEIYITNESSSYNYQLDVWHNSTRTDNILDNDYINRINATVTLISPVAMTVSLQIYNWTGGTWQNCTYTGAGGGLVPPGLPYSLSCAVCADASCNVVTGTPDEVNSDFRAPVGTDTNRSIRIRLNSTPRPDSLQSNLTIDYIRYSINYTKVACGDVINRSVNFSHDLSGSGTCLSVGADDIYINCTGSTLTGDGSGYGIFNPQFDNVVIRDCSFDNFDRAIHFTNGSDNAVLLNNTATNGNVGFSVNASLSPSLWGNRGVDVQQSGILLNGSNWANIFNSTFASPMFIATSQNRQIYLHHSNHSFIYNNSVQTNRFAGVMNGIQVEACNHTTISNLSVPLSEVGVYLFQSNSTRFENSTIDTFDVYGLFLSSSNATYTHNVSITNGTTSNPLGVFIGRGIYVYQSNSNLFQNLSVMNTSESGIYLAISNNNYFENFTIARNGLVTRNSIYLTLANDTTFSNVSVLHNSNANGIYFDQSLRNQFRNFTVRNHSAGYYFASASTNNMFINSSVFSAVTGVHFEGASSNNYFVNSTFQADLAVEAIDACINNTFLNSTVDIHKMTVSEPDSYVRIKWYSRIRVLDYAGAGIDGAYFNISNNTDSLLFSNLTDGAIGSGYSNWTILEQGVLTGGGASFFSMNNHTFNASKDGYLANWTNATVNQSGSILVYLPSAAADLSFTLNYPPTGCVGGQGNSTEDPSSACSLAHSCACDQVYIKTNVTSLDSGLANQNCTAPQGQTATFAFLNFTNAGSVALNWTVQLNETLPATLALVINQTADTSTCDYTVNITTSAFEVNNSVAIGDSAFAWLYGNFTGAKLGTTERELNVTSWDAS